MDAHKAVKACFSSSVSWQSGRRSLFMFCDSRFYRWWKKSILLLSSICFFFLLSRCDFTYSLLLLLLLLLYLCCLLSQTFSPPTSPHKTNSYPQSSCSKFHIAALSILCVMFLVQLPLVSNLFNVFMHCICILVVCCSSFHWPNCCCFSM